MAKRKSDTRKLIDFAMAETTTEDALNATIETLIAVRMNRFPPSKPKPSRKQRSDAGKPRVDNKSNGADSDAVEG